ncbi:Lar family restriction alleviation protein, partial [Citrobacter portucalensis]|uniref:Lar family restriction alleviation protein n=1 Tax=Citrobacter portucalensis TaxID=1639133 RepID=UPI003B430DA4
HVSLDRLHQIREILSKATAQSDGGNLGYAMADAVKVIDGAIAAFGAKLDENGLLPCPLCGGGAEFDYDDDNLNWISCSACGISTDTVYHTDIDARDKLREVWNRRTAMFQAGNSPATPDGWQLVPKEPTEAMNKAGWAAMNEHDAINPTYRAMLAAAPQQDVRLALEIGMSRYAGAMQKLVDSGD